MTPFRPPIMARRHAVSAGHYLAAHAGHAMLEAGGNAIDAGVAAGLTMGVVQSDLVNFAGVAPILIRLADRPEVISIDGLGVWPALADRESLRRLHGHAVPEGLLRTVVPAAPAAWLTALERYGTMSFADVAEAAIRHAGEGYALDAFMAGFIADHESDYRRWDANSAIYLPGGRPPKHGEVFVQGDLARTIQYMVDQEAAHAGQGREAGIRAAYDAFYRGDIARTIVAHHEAHGGWLRMSDLDGYRVRFEPTASTRFRDLEVHGCGPWSQGPSLPQTFALLEGFDLAAMGHNRAGYVHTVVEAIKLAFADREHWYGDPAVVDVPVAALLGAEYTALRRAMIDPDRAAPDLPPPGDPRAMLAAIAARPSPEVAAGTGSDPHDTVPAAGESSLADTSYVCAVDAAGNVFSATPSDTSCDTEVIPGTGLCPSSRGCQSRLDADHPTALAPGKRPRLTPNPALALKNGEPYLAFGTPGGDVQVQAMVQVVLNIELFGMDVQSAIEAPRFSSYSFPSSFSPFESYPGLLALEDRIDGADIEKLERLGHRIERWPSLTRKAGAVCAIRIDPDTGVREAGADPRRAAYALGR